MSTPRRGFTLVELLVVIGIIALLIAILLPTLNKAREQANVVKCLSNLRQMAAAANLMATERRGYIQPSSEKDEVLYNDPSRQKFIYRVGGSATTTVPADWASGLLPYLGDRSGQTFFESQDKSQVFVCPSDPAIDMNPKGYWMVVNLGNSLATPLSYGINADIACVTQANGQGRFNFGGIIGVWGGPGTQFYASTGTTRTGQPLGARLNKVFKPAETLLFADCGVRPIQTGTGLVIAVQTAIPTTGNALDYSATLAYSTNFVESNPQIADGIRGTLEGVAKTGWLGRRIPYLRHGKAKKVGTEFWEYQNARINVAFCDGHAETVAASDFGRVRVSPYRY